MNNIVSKNIFRFIILVLFQVLILNNIRFWGYINPYLYVLFILLLPFDTPKWLQLISAFLLGWSVDVFSGTLGLHAASSVFMAFCRPAVLSRMINIKEEYEAGAYPSMHSLGFKWFFSYSAVLILLHHFVLFYLEIFRFSEFFSTFFRVILSSVFTLVLVLLAEYLFYNSKKNR